MSDDLQQKYDPQGVTPADGVTSRVRYFDGQFLKDQDFVDDQKYHIDRQRRVNRLLRVSGICEGLTLEVKDKKIYANPGTALDSQGRLLVLTEKQEVSDLNPSENGTQTVYIAYQIQPDAVTQGSNEIIKEANEDTEDNSAQSKVLRGTKGATRLNETPLVTTKPNEFAVALGQAIVQGRSVTVTCGEEREYSGVYLPGGEDGKGGPSLRSGDSASALAILQGSLSVTKTLSVSETSTLLGKVGIGDELGDEQLKVSGNTAVTGTSHLIGNVGIGTAPDHQKKLKVTGNTQIAGDFSVTNNSTLNGSLTVNNIIALKGSSNTIGLNVNGSGNVGIGIADSGYKLQVGDPNTVGVSKLAISGRGTTGTSNHWRTWTVRTGDGSTSGDIHKLRIRDENAGVDRLAINENGDVGIGTENPSQKLEVNGNLKVVDANLTGTLTVSGSTLINLGEVKVYDINSTDKRDWGSKNISINAGAYISCQAVFTRSDGRIKSICSRSNGTLDLRKLIEIEITDFSYQDVVNNGNVLCKKVIGQQVEQVFPQAVSRKIDVVPDIYKVASVHGDWIILATDLQIGERVKLITEEGEEVIQKVLEVTPGKIRVDFKLAGESVFVFGREVNDFRVVDYDAISMLNVSATQELYKQINILQTEVKQLKRDIRELRSEKLLR